MDTYMNEFDFLREQAVSEDLIKEILEFRKEYTVAADAVGRVQQPAIHFYGKETLEMAMAALLQGENLLLTGPKATGKNILAENLAYIFGRPIYNVSFHVNTNSGDLIGTDTFEDNQVKLRKGSGADRCICVPDAALSGLGGALCGNGRKARRGMQ